MILQAILSAVHKDIYTSRIVDPLHFDLDPDPDPDPLPGKVLPDQELKGTMNRDFFVPFFMLTQHRKKVGPFFIKVLKLESVF